jgi:hypothetical protein
MFKGWMRNREGSNGLGKVRRGTLKFDKFCDFHEIFTFFKENCIFFEEFWLKS